MGSGVDTTGHMSTDQKRRRAWYLLDKFGADRADALMERLVKLKRIRHTDIDRLTEAEVFEVLKRLEAEAEKCRWR